MVLGYRRNWKFEQLGGVYNDYFNSIGLSSYDDRLESLIRLKQISTVEEYRSKFEALFNWLQGLSESYKLSYFLSGLKNDIQLPVRMFNPNNLLSTYSLVKI